jgi:hypothetical protein
LINLNDSVAARFADGRIGVSVELSQFDAKIKAARDTIAAYEARLDEIVSHFYSLVGDDFYDGGSTTLDFRTLLKKYAHSKNLDPMLLKSEMLYKDMIPHMIREVLEGNYPDDHWTDRLPRHLREEIDHDDEDWVAVVADHGGYEFPTYTYAEFLQIVPQKEVPATGPN